MRLLSILSIIGVFSLGLGCHSESVHVDDEATEPKTTGTGAGPGSSSSMDSATGDDDTGHESKPQQLTGNPCDPLDNPWDCSPVREDACGEDQACDWAVTSKIGAFECRDDRTLGQGETCQPANSKCGPGLKCMAPINTCVRYCCSDEDCVDADFDCGYRDKLPKPVEGGQLGLCYKAQLLGDVCAGDNPWPCDPVTNDGCEAGYSCQFGSFDGLIAEFQCIPSGSSTEGNSCSVADGYLCEPGLACVDHICRRFCCADDECGEGVPCKYESLLGPKYTGGSLGFCVPSHPPCPGVCTIQMDLSQYGFPVCENGTVYKNYFDCPEPDKTGCCQQVPEDEVGKPCPVPLEGAPPNGFECKDALGAVLGHCPAVHHEYLCPRTANDKKQWCCELDPKIAQAFAEPTP